MMTDDTVFILWCRLTGNDLASSREEERVPRRPQVDGADDGPYEVLLDAGVTAGARCH